MLSRKIESLASFLSLRKKPTPVSPDPSSPPTNPTATSSCSDQNSQTPANKASNIPHKAEPNASSPVRDQPIDERRDESHAAIPSDGTLNASFPSPEGAKFGNEINQHEYREGPSIQPLTRQAINPFGDLASPAAREWELRKTYGDQNEILDKLMNYEGFENAKKLFIDIQWKVRTCPKRGRDPLRESYSIAIHGNPGTGRSTVGYLYAELLHSLGVIPSRYIKETSGFILADMGPISVRREFDRILSQKGGGVIIINDPYTQGKDKRFVDMVLQAMEDHRGKLAAIFVGHKSDMQPVWSRLLAGNFSTCYIPDMNEAQIWRVLYDGILREYKGHMRVEDGLSGKPMRITVRRLVNANGNVNAKAVQEALSRISQRQERRLKKEEEDGKSSDYTWLTQADVIGPPPCEVIEQSEAWEKFQELVGLDAAKESMRNAMRIVDLNYQLELQERKLLRQSCHRLFMGRPGVGKTTVARLYAQVLADLELVTGVIYKTSSDLAGDSPEQLVTKTKDILDLGIDHVLLIDNAHTLSPVAMADITSSIQGAPFQNRWVILIGQDEGMLNMLQKNPTLSQFFPLETHVRCESYSLSQLEDIMQRKLNKQGIECTSAALQVAKEIFERRMMYPDFANATEVDRCLERAKINRATRKSNGRSSKIYPEDFDPDLDREAVDSYRLLRGEVHEDIIEKLVGYQIRYLKAKKSGINPRGVIPTRFVLKGPPGTGKSITAQHIGRLFYNVGFLSTPEVVGYTMTDLLGESPGQSRFNTRRHLQQGLGKVLFLDNASCLNHKQHSQTVDELLYLLTQPNYIDKTVIILAGDMEQLDTLFAAQPVLSGHFAEEIIFHQLPAEVCITLLVRELKKNSVTLKSDLAISNSPLQWREVRNLFRDLQGLPGWTNARDVEQLGKRILGKFLEWNTETAVEELSEVPVSLVKQCMQEIKEQRNRRSLTTGKSLSNSAPDLVFQLPPMSQTFPETGPDVTRITEQTLTEFQSWGASKHDHKEFTYQSNGAATEKRSSREPDTSDEEWSELRYAQIAARERDSYHRGRWKQVLQDMEVVEEAIEEANEKTKETEHEDSPEDHGRQGFLQKFRQLENRVSDIIRVRVNEEKVQRALREMNKCENQYSWFRVCGGYRCDGGKHFISENELQEKGY
ncbi:hypothetical protein ASPWEDRAFT_164108, partial [Aspergillus wentii DTO 134E9]